MDLGDTTLPSDLIDVHQRLALDTLSDPVTHLDRDDNAFRRVRGTCPELDAHGDLGDAQCQEGGLEVR